MSIPLPASHPVHPVRLGAVGAGGRLRSLLARVLTSGSPVTLAAVHDPLPHSLAECRRLFGASFAVHDDWPALVRDPAIDWVWIGSPNNCHAAQAIAALEAGKDVFCEKPLATTPEDCLAVREAVRRSGRTFAFGLVLRYSPFYQKVRDVVASGRLGELVSFEFNETLGFNHGGYIFGNWRRHRAVSGSHLLEKCCHDLDIVRWLTGRLPVRVASFGGRRFFTPAHAPLAAALGTDSRGRPAYRTWDDPLGTDPFAGDADIVDHQVAILEYPHGLRATFHTNCNAAILERRVYLLGSRGSLRADACTGRIEFAPIAFDAPIEQIEVGSGQLAHAGGDDVLAQALVRTMTAGEPPLAGIDEALASSFCAFGIDAALEQGTVEDLRPLWQRAGIEP
jgi:predicted dehydrogenase